MFRLQERKTGRKLGLRIIIDLDGFNSDHISAAGIKSYSNALKYLQVFYNNFLSLMFCVIVY